MEIVRPTSIAERWDVMLIASESSTHPRACAAALGLCWPRLRRRLPYRGDALKYGGDVIDLLVGEGASWKDVVALGSEALAMLAEGLVAVEGAEGFSTPPNVAEHGQKSGG